jgi:hypothetical protein
MPLNLLDTYFPTFERNVLPKLIARDMAVLGMKPLAEGKIPRIGLVSAIDALHFAMSLPTTTVITGCETMKRINQALEVTRSFKPLSSEQMAAKRHKMRQVAMTGRLELFKTSHMFDGTTNPNWMG